MKCDNCGAEIPEGQLYCANCGREINIVPYFEPDLETQLSETIQNISDAVLEQSQSTIKKQKRKHHYLIWVLLLVMFSIVSGIIGVLYLYESPMYQVNRGNRYVNEQKYKEAIDCYKKALSNEPENPTYIYMYLIKCFEMLQYDGEYEEYLLRIIASNSASESQERLAYSKLIALYIEGNSYQTINNLLKSCKNDKIVSTYSELLVSAPCFSHKDGLYNEIIPLKITSPSGDKIYYTMDGTMPTKESLVYDKPIFLEDGFYEIRAICIDENGVLSDLVTKVYEVNFATK